MLGVKNGAREKELDVGASHSLLLRLIFSRYRHWDHPGKIEEDTWNHGVRHSKKKGPDIRKMYH